MSLSHAIAQTSVTMQGQIEQVGLSQLYGDLCANQDQQWTNEQLKID